MTSKVPDLYIPPSATGPELRPEWSMRLVMDVALGTSTDSILEAHELQHHQLERITASPQFALQVAELRRSLEKEGATFKLKCQLQADFYLTKVHEKIMDPGTDEKVFTRLVEDVVRWAGMDAPQAVGAGALGGFEININFGTHRREGITIDQDS